MRLILLAIIILAGLLPQSAPIKAQTITERISGYIVLDVENNGEAWYVYPENRQRYYLGRPHDAFDIMRFLGLGITNSDLSRIPTSEQTSFSGDTALRQRLSGYILLQVQENGEAWYVYPENLRRYYLGRPDDAFSIMRFLGLGITAADLATIPIAKGSLVPPGADSEYKTFTMTISRGSFPVRVSTLQRDAFEMITDTAETSECENNCLAFSLADYANQNNATHGIHGTYFCPPDYSQCAGKVNTYDSPVYNTEAGVMLNDEKLRFHNGPMLAYGKNGQYYFYHLTRGFGTAEEFAKREETQLQAAIANWPSLVENGQVVVEGEDMDDNQRNIKGVRGAIGYDADSVFLVVASSSTVIDLAYIMRELGATNAVNLDGGGTAALYHEGDYKFGPGRLLPNAIVFRRK